MFKQIKDLAGGEYYLIASLLVFMAFFLIVTLYLIRINKQHIELMSQMPIDNQPAAPQDEED